MGFLLGCGALGCVLALAAAAAWVRLADPPTARMERGGALLGEQQLDQQVGITVWFLVIGAVLGLVCGLVVAAVARRYGVLSVLGVLIACVVASLLSGWLGIHVLGPDRIAGPAVSVGTIITSPLSIGTRVAYLGWPLGGMLGAVLAIVWWPVQESPGPQTPSSTIFMPR